MNKRNIKITRPKPNNSLRRARFILGIHVEPDVCNPKKWVVTSWKKTYQERFDSKLKAYVWLHKNLRWIAGEHLPPGRLKALIRNGIVAPNDDLARSFLGGES